MRRVSGRGTSRQRRRYHGSRARNHLTTPSTSHRRLAPSLNSLESDTSRFEQAISRLKTFSKSNKARSRRDNLVQEWILEHQRLSRLASRLERSLAGVSVPPAPLRLCEEDVEEDFEGMLIEERLEEQIRRGRSKLKVFSALRTQRLRSPSLDSSDLSDPDIDPSLRFLFESRISSLEHAESLRLANSKDSKRVLRLPFSSLSAFQLSLIRKLWLQNLGLDTRRRRSFESLVRKARRELSWFRSRRMQDEPSLFHPSLPSSETIQRSLTSFDDLRRHRMKERGLRQEYRSEVLKVRESMTSALLYSAQMTRLQREAEAERHEREKERKRLGEALAVMRGNREEISRQRHLQRLEAKKSQAARERLFQQNCQLAREKIRKKIEKYRTRLQAKESQARMLEAKQRRLEEQQRLSQGRLNRQRTRFRHREWNARQEAKRIEQERQRERIEAREDRLEDLRRQVRDQIQVNRDPIRARGSTTSSKIRKDVRSERDKLWRDRIHSFTSEEVFRDMRAKLLSELQVAGLLQTKYAREMIGAMGSQGGRRDNLTSNQRVGGAWE